VTRGTAILTLAAVFCMGALLWAPPAPDGYATVLLAAVFVGAVLRLDRARTVGLLCAGEPIVVLTATANVVPALVAQALLLVLVLADAGVLTDRHEAGLFWVFVMPASAAAYALTAAWEPAVSMLLLAAGLAAGAVVLALSGYRARHTCETRRPAK